jgi:hypothetical protein
MILLLGNRLHRIAAPKNASGSHIARALFFGSSFFLAQIFIRGTTKSIR